VPTLSPFRHVCPPGSAPLDMLNLSGPNPNGPGRSERGGAEERRGEERGAERSGRPIWSLPPSRPQPGPPAGGDLRLGSARPELGAGPRIAGELSAEYVRARGAPIRGARIQLRGQAAARAANQATGWPAPRCIRCLTSNPNSWSPNWPSAGPLGRRGANR